MYVFFFPTSIFISLFFIKPKDWNILYVLYVHFVQSDNATSENLQHITKELHRFMGQTCTRTFAVTYNRNEPLQIT